MAEEMGEDDIFIFGMTVADVDAVKSQGYNAMEFYNNDPELKQVVDLIKDGFFSPGNENEFSATYMDQAKWAEMAIHNIASSGKFSSDRTIAEYAREIWGMEPSYEKLPDPHGLTNGSNE